MDARALLALSLLPVSRARLAEAAGYAHRLDGGFESALARLHVPRDHGRQLLDEAGAQLAAGAAAGLSLTVLTDPSYPPGLREIADPPLVLWRRGELPVPDRPAVAVVGSRAASPSAAEMARRLGRGLAERGMVVVSGMARGCDGEAHRGALEAGGATVAVLGSGADVCYPPEHATLADDIARTGAVLSEFSPGTPPLAHHFPLRNRLISGLSRAVVVVEAGAKSGSLITASCALEQGRDVMVVPGGVLSGRNRGGHALLRDGAALVESVDDVLFALGMVTPPSAGPPGDRGAGDPILAALEVDEGLDVDELSARVGLGPDALLARLSELELDGLVARMAGGRFVRFSGKVIT